MRKDAIWKLVGSVAWPLAAFLFVFYVFLIVNYLHTLGAGSVFEPGQGLSESIVKPAVHRGEPLPIIMIISVNETGCTVHVRRIVIDSVGKIVWQIYVINPTYLTSSETFLVSLPDMIPAKYYYKADVYLNCIERRSFVRSTELLPFEIVE